MLARVVLGLLVAGAEEPVPEGLLGTLEEALPDWVLVVAGEALADPVLVVDVWLLPEAVPLETVPLETVPLETVPLEVAAPELVLVEPAPAVAEPDWPARVCEVALTAVLAAELTVESADAGSEPGGGGGSVAA